MDDRPSAGIWSSLTAAKSRFHLRPHNECNGLVSTVEDVPGSPSCLQVRKPEVASSLVKLLATPDAPGRAPGKSLSRPKSVADSHRRRCSTLPFLHPVIGAPSPLRQNPFGAFWR
jgi:hypothetical protein